MNRKLILGAAVALTAVSSPAFAQNATTLHPYVGALVGLDDVKLEALGESGSKNDLMYGALAGVEFDINPSVFLGIEGEINDSKVSESVEDAFVLGDELRASVGREIFIGGRVGFRATPNFTVYGVGGYSNVRGKLTYDDGVTRASESDTVDGYRLGAGVEYRVGAVRLRGEYRHAEYENIDVLGVDVDPSRDQFVGAVVFGF